MEEDDSDKATTLKKAYADMILNTAKESASRVMVSDRNSARFHHDLCVTKDEALRLLVRLKQMIDAKTIEGEIISLNKQREIDLLEAQLHEAEDIITDLRSEMRWVRDKLEKAREVKNVVYKELETVAARNNVDIEVVVGTVDPNRDRSESLPNQSSLYDDDECGGDDETVYVHPEVVVGTVDPNQDRSDSLPNKSAFNDDECGGNETVSALEVVVGTVHPNQDQDRSVTLANQSALYDDECSGNETVSAPAVVDGTVHPNQDRSDSLMNQSAFHDDECGGNETISATKVVASLHTNQEDKDMSESLPNQSSLYDDECENDEKQVYGLSGETSKVCESELDADIRNKKLEMSRNGCTQRIHALERKSSPSVNEVELRTTEKDGEENLSSVNTRCLVLALRARNAEVIPIKPSNGLGIKKPRKLQGKRKRRWSVKRKATAIRSQSQLIKPCQSHSDIPCFKTSVESSDDKDSMDTHLSVENEEIDDLNACKGLEEHLQHNIDAINSNVDLTLGSTNATVISVNATNRSTDKDLKSRKDDSTNPSSTMGCSDLKATAVVSNRISESPRADGNRLVKYTFQRKRKREL